MRETRPLPPAFTVPKVEGQRNEDSYQRSSRGVYALSDGASISFDSAAWAKILVRRFAQNPNFSQEWLRAAIAQFQTLHNRENLLWMQQASFDRGSFASLLGIRMLDEHGLIQLDAVGDTLAVLCDGDSIVATFPYTKAAQFDQSPQLLCTNPTENAFLEIEDCVRNIRVDWTFSGLERPILFCMTDALGQWLLSWSDPDHSAVSILRSIKTPRAFARFVREERASGRMRRDDTTLMAIQ